MPQAILCIDCNEPALRSPCGKCAPSRRKPRPGDWYASKEWRDLKAQAKEFLGDQCAICNSAKRVTYHHRKARGAGGADSVSNLMPLCGSCHARYEGFKKRGASNPFTRRIENA